MYLVVIAWLYVTLMMAVAEATNTTGSVLGAVITFGLYGLLPMGLVIYIFGTPARKRALRAREAAEQEAYEAQQAQQAQATQGDAEATGPAEAAQRSGAMVAEPNARGEAPATATDGSVAPVRKEP